MKVYLSGLLFILSVFIVNAVDSREVYVVHSKNDVEITVPKTAVDNVPPGVFRLKVNELE